MSRFQLLLAAPFLIAGIARAQSTDSTAGKSVWQGVYTEEQATRGDTEHQNNCSSCHGTEKYSGDAFTKNWVGRTVFDLFDQIKTTMPDDNPGGLSDSTVQGRRCVHPEDQRHPGGHRFPAE